MKKKVLALFVVLFSSLFALRGQADDFSFGVVIQNLTSQTYIFKYTEDILPDAMCYVEKPSEKITNKNNKNDEFALVKIAPQSIVKCMCGATCNIQIEGMENFKVKRGQKVKIENGKLTLID